MKLSSLKYPYISQFHILRHFSKIDENYRTILKVNTSFTDEDINKQLAIVGSNFHPGFSKNPIQLWEKIQGHEKFLYPETKEWDKNRFTVILFFKQKDYTDGIGEDALVSLDDLLPAEKNFSQEQDRDDITVKYVPVNRQNPTWQINIVLGNEPEPMVRTIFPGIYAPPLPDPVRLTKTEFIESKQFWDAHAFIT